MPTGATDAAEAVPPSTLPNQAAEAGCDLDPGSARQHIDAAGRTTGPRVSAPSTSVVSASALKAQLRARLTALLDDETFMDFLVAEYQQQLVSLPQQSPHTSLPQQSSHTSPSDAVSTRAVQGHKTGSDDVPAHLMALLQQQMTTAWGTSDGSR